VDVHDKFCAALGRFEHAPIGNESAFDSDRLPWRDQCGGRDNGERKATIAASEGSSEAEISSCASVASEPAWNGGQNRDATSRRKERNLRRIQETFKRRSGKRTEARPMRIPFPYDIWGIYSRIVLAFHRHSNACRHEIIELRAENARLEQENERLKEQLKEQYGR